MPCWIRASLPSPTAILIRHRTAPLPPLVAGPQSNMTYIQRKSTCAHIHAHARGNTTAQLTMGRGYAPPHTIGLSAYPIMYFYSRKTPD